MDGQGGVARHQGLRGLVGKVGGREGGAVQRPHGELHGDEPEALVLGNEDADRLPAASTTVERVMISKSLGRTVLLEDGRVFSVMSMVLEKAEEALGLTFGPTIDTSIRRRADIPARGISTSW